MYTKAVPDGLTIFITRADLFHHVSIAHRQHRSILIDTQAPIWCKMQTASNTIILIARRINHQILANIFFPTFLYPRDKTWMNRNFFFYFFSILFLRIASMLMIDCSLDIFVTFNKNNINNNYQTVAKFNSILQWFWMILCLPNTKGNGFLLPWIWNQYNHPFALISAFFYQTTFLIFFFYSFNEFHKCFRSLLLCWDWFWVGTLKCSQDRLVIIEVLQKFISFFLLNDFFVARSFHLVERFKKNHCIQRKTVAISGGRYQS